jgi:hypothetical protein
MRATTTLKPVSWRPKNTYRCHGQGLVLAFVGLVILGCVSGVAQTANSQSHPLQSTPAQTGAPLSESKGIVEEIGDAIAKDATIKAGIASLIALIIGSVITATVSIIQSHKKDAQLTELQTRAQTLNDEKNVLEKDKESLEQTNGGLVHTNGELRRRLTGVRFQLPEQYIESYNRVLLVGLGGSGKTTLIRELTGNKSASPRIKSADLLTYSLVHEIVYQEINYAKSHVCRIDIDDYRGQEPAQILAGWNVDKLEAPPAFSCTSVIFLVDLFEEPAHAGDTQEPQETWNNTRVQKHLTEWPQSLVRSVIYMARQGNLKYICLFVNKVDLLSVYSTAKAPEIFALFGPIDDALASVSAGALYERIVGSAAKDIGVSQVLNRLVEVSSPAGPGP